MDHRIFVATWNVAGKSPPGYLNLEDWLHASPPADIYVLGYTVYGFKFMLPFLFRLFIFSNVTVLVKTGALFDPFWFSGFKKSFP